MKIAFLANTCWNIYNFRKGLVHYFISRGDEVIVLTPQDEYVSKVKDWGVKWINTPLEGTGSNPLKDLKYLKCLKTIFKDEKPQVVLSYTVKSNIYGSFASKKTGVPIICNVSGLGAVFLVKGITGVIAMQLYRRAFKYSHFVFFQNKDDQQLFNSKIPISSEKQGLLPGSGINLEEFKPQQYNYSDKVKILMIARVIIEKGVREYAEAAKMLKENKKVSFTLVGKMDEMHARSISREELDSWEEEDFLEYLPHSNEIKELINQHELVVLPSYREGTPRTLLEAAAMGKPILTTNVAGCKEVVEDGENGFLFEAKNAESLKNSIEKYLDLEKNERETLGEKSRGLAEYKFDEKIVFSKYEKIIKQILNQN